MRIITGSRKGQRLKIPTGSRVRPTSDRVRAAIFNILPLDLSGLRVLDLYAGSGALGMEALSRGALSAVFVDSAAKVVKDLAANLKKLHLMEMSRIMAKKTLPALKLLAAEGQVFDLVFADPPYGGREIEKILPELTRLRLLSEEAIVVVEHGKEKDLAPHYGELSLFDHRVYGGTAVSFYQRGGGSCDQ